MPTVVHGTFIEAWESIKDQGLSTMNRTHIHFAPGSSQGQKVISGIRADYEVYIHIDLASALRDGYTFYKSDHDVILCSGDSTGYLPAIYFKKVIRQYRGFSEQWKRVLQRWIAS